MVKLVSSILFVGVFLVLEGTFGSGVKAMELSSPAFENGGKIPVRYVMPGAGGDNVSIPLVWKDPPKGTRSFALSIVDPHPVARNWVHWLVTNIPAEANGLPEGSSNKKMPSGAVELTNSFGSAGYGGPQPPKGTGDHPYVATLYALSVDKLNLGSKTDLGTFKKALQGNVLAEAAVTGHFGR